MSKKHLSGYFLRAAFAVLLMAASSAAQTPVNLGTAAGYAVLAGSAVTNTGASVVTGDLGVSPGTAVTGFPPGTVIGTTRTAAAAAGAQTDLTTAYNDALGRTPSTVATELGSQTLAPGVYNSAAGTFGITGTLTLDGQNNPNAVFILQAASTLITAAGAPGTPASQVVLTRGAQPCNVFWQVGSSATLGTYSIFQGNILASASITVDTGATVSGRVLARTAAVTLDTNSITTPVCSVTPPLAGSIQVVKNTIGGNGTFLFSSNFGVSSLTTSGTSSGGTASQTFASLTPGGSYSVSEIVPSGWTQTSASCTNGTPAAVTVVTGITTVCTFVNTLNAGLIQVVKNTIGGNGTFPFTSSFGVSSLTTTGTSSGGTASQTSASLTAGGSYSVSEIVPTGWTQTSATCTNGTPAAVTVVTGVTTICTFVNTLNAGLIQVVKNTIGGNGTFLFASNFGVNSLTTTGTNSGGTASQTSASLIPGTYSVSEIVPTGWTQTSATCTNGTPAAVTVVTGVTTICTFVDTLNAGLIQVVKNTIGGNGTFLFTSNFGVSSLTTTGTSSGGTASQTSASLTPGGSYSVSEIVPTGWTQTSATCTNGTPAAVTVVTGVTTICTFVNTLNAGLIQVVKNTIGGNGTFLFSSNFGVNSLTTTGTNSGGTASQTSASLIPGTYSVSEIVPTGWTQTSATCTNGTPAAVTVVTGVTTICTFVDTLNAGLIQVVKNTIGGNGTFPFTSNFGVTSLTTTGTSSGGTASQTSGSLTPGGSYSVSESVPAGWTQTSATCTNGTPAAVTVVTGATTICTFVNTLNAGLIQVVKNTIGGNGTFPFTSNFGVTSLTTTGSSSGGTASQTSASLTPGGSYSVSETVPTGWTQTSAICTNGTPAAVTVVAGVTTICTFVNTLNAGLIQVVKNTIGGNGTFPFTSNFGVTSLTTTGTSSGGTASQTSGSLTPGGSYSVSESVPAGWTQTSATCTNGTPANITVVTGVTTICTFVDTLNAGLIQVVKNTIGGNGTFQFTSNFGVTSLTTSGTSSGGTASQTSASLTPGGSYSVTETVPTGWTQTSATCTKGTPAAVTVVTGATTICTFVNTLNLAPTGVIQVVKNTIGGNGTFLFTSNFGVTSLTTQGGTASQTFSSVTAGGSYSVSETVPTGWTQTGASCTNGTPAAITVVAGATTICTFTNAAVLPDVTISKSHAGNFRQGDTGDTYTLTVTNAGQGSTTGAVTASDMLPAGLTATAISGAGWSCTLTPLACTRSDVLAAGASYPVITVTVSVATSGLVFIPAAGSPAFRTGDILISMADGTVQWRRSDWTLVKVLTSGTNGEAKGMAFDSSGNLLVTYWTGSGSTGNDVARFDRNGNPIGFFGTGYNCNPSSIIVDNSGNVYVGQADCSGQILKFDSSGNPLAEYSVAVENRGSYWITLDPNQCTMYYTSVGPDVKRFNVCTGTQMPNFNSTPLPDPGDGGQKVTLLPGGGMLVGNFSVIARLDASGNLVATYKTPTGSQCWLGTVLDLDGTSFWAGNYCTSSVTRFDIATGNVIESQVASATPFLVKQIAIPGNIFSNLVTNTATVAGGGELNSSNNSASDATTINPPTQPPPASSFSISPTVATVSASAATGSVTVTAPAGAAWTAASNSGFIIVTSGASGIGNGTVGYAVAANSTGPSRTGTMTIADQAFTLTQTAPGACVFSISPPSTNLGSGAATTGGTLSGSFLLTGTNCTASDTWTAVSDSPLLLITSAASGNGAAPTTIDFSMYANSSTLTRVAHITVGGQSFTVTQAGATQQAPTPDVASPSSGSGMAQTMTYTFSDSRGYTDLGVVNILINNFLDGRAACYLAYSEPLNVLYLVNDSGTGLSAGLALNGGGSIGNSQCTINGAGSSASGAGNTLTLTLNITFGASFAGNKVVYLAAGDVTGRNSGWLPSGVWQVPGAAPAITTAVTGMSPSSTAVYSQPYTFTFTDSKGYQDIGVVDILVNDYLTGNQACYIAYSRPGNVVYLVNDPGTALLPGMVLNGSGSVSNSQCTITAAGSSASGTANRLTLTLNIAFSGSFWGNRIFYLATRDVNEANNTGWQALGAWIVE